MPRHTQKVATHDPARHLQRTRCQVATRSRKRRLHALYDRMCRPDMRWRAWREGRQGGGTMSTRGITTSSGWGNRPYGLRWRGLATWPWWHDDPPRNRQAGLETSTDSQRAGPQPYQATAASVTSASLRCPPRLTPAFGVMSISDEPKGGESWQTFESPPPEEWTPS